MINKIFQNRLDRMRSRARALRAAEQISTHIDGLDETIPVIAPAHIPPGPDPELEKLRRERDHFRAALQRIAAYSPRNPIAKTVVAIAKNALEEK